MTYRFIDRRIATVIHNNISSPHRLRGLMKPTSFAIASFLMFAHTGFAQRQVHFVGEGPASGGISSTSDFHDFWEDRVVSKERRAGAPTIDCDQNQLEVVGQVPDVIFFAGRPETDCRKSPTGRLVLPWIDIPNGQRSCGIFLHSNVQGVGLSVGGVPLMFGDVSPSEEIAVAGSGSDPLRPRTDLNFCVGASANAGPTNGVVDLFDKTVDVGPNRLVGGVNVYVMNQRDAYPLAFVHSVRRANSRANYTLIEHSFLNGNPRARLLVTPRYSDVCHVGNPCPGRYHNHNVGVFYSVRDEKWAIFNQDSLAMQSGTTFNVRIEGNFGLTVTAGRTNTEGDKVFLDFPGANANERAAVYVTATFFPHGQSPIYNDHSVGVGFDTVRARWYIENEDGAPIPLGLIFNVKIVSIPDFGGVRTFTAMSSGVYRRNEMIIVHPDFDDSRQIVFATHRISPRNGSTPNPHPTGVQFDGRHWTVANQDRQQMPGGSVFNIFAARKPVFGE